MNLDDPQDRDVGAGEYVLGTLDAAERARFESTLATDAALQAAVYAWQDRLLPLAGRVAPADDAGLAWAAIEARLGAAPRAVMALPPAPTKTDAPAANDPLWRRLRRWQIGSALAMVASVLIATLLLLRAPPWVERERYLAVLQAPGDNTAGWLVEVTAGERVRLVPIGRAAPVPTGRSVQFWTKAQSATAPTSLGLVTPGQVTELPVARLPAVEAQQLFELTLEPEAGSPTGRPTGPILYVGRTVRL
ncbi:MAG: anti-sigma factor [Burkholderiaceae bacterium]